MITDANIEDLAVRIANLSGLHWKDLDEVGKERYRFYARQDQAREVARRNDEQPIPMMTVNFL
jgi:hypothetical protein